MKKSDAGGQSQAIQTELDVEEKRREESAWNGRSTPACPINWLAITSDVEPAARLGDRSCPKSCPSTCPSSCLECCSKNAEGNVQPHLLRCEPVRYERKEKAQLAVAAANTGANT